MDLEKLCSFFERLYRDHNLHTDTEVEETGNLYTKRKRKKYKPKKWARIVVQPDGSLLYEGLYRKHEFSVVIPNKINDLNKQLTMIQEITWGYAQDFYLKYIEPNLNDIKNKLTENGNVVIRFVFHNPKIKPVIYSEIPKSEFESLLEEVENRGES